MASAGGGSTPLTLRKWQDFYTACWGHPSGAVLEGIPFLVSSMGYFVGPVLVRDVYSQVYDWVAAELERITDDKTACTNLVVFGSPGIGAPVPAPMPAVR